MPIRAALLTDLPRLGDVLGRAFDDDPLFRAILPDDAQRRRALPAMFAEWTRLLHLGPERSFTTDDLAGAALWSPPGAWKVGLWNDLKMAPSMLPRLGIRTVASLRVLAAIEARHPKPPHHYLRVLATDPDKQRQGIAGRLLAPMLARCDAEGTPAYLETAKDSNLHFYRRHGFEVTEEVVTHLGPKVWLMWREPRRGAVAIDPVA